MWLVNMELMQITAWAMEVDRLRADLHNAQSGIEFLQKEHAVMLAGLHEEVERLQQKCSGKFVQPWLIYVPFKKKCQYY